MTGNAPPEILAEALNALRQRCEELQVQLNWYRFRVRELEGCLAASWQREERRGSGGSHSDVPPERTQSASLAERQLQSLARELDQKEAVIIELHAAAQERLRLIDELQVVVDQQGRRINELATAADERLRLIQELDAIARERSRADA